MDVTTGTTIVVILVDISGAKDTNKTWFTPPEESSSGHGLKLFPLGIREVALLSPSKALH